MIFEFTARHFKAHESLKEFAKEEAEKLKKYYDGIIKCEVILSYDKPTNSIKRTEVIVSANNKHTFTAKEDANDFRISLDAAFDKVKKQVRRFKEKLKSNHTDKTALQMGFSS